jgi:hypothetical protein
MSVVGTVARQQTIRINQGYQVDSKWEAIALTGRGVRRAAAVLWRWRTELGLIAAVVLLRLIAGRYVPALAAWLVTVSAIAGAVGWSWSRTLITGRLACARARRRLLACMRETRVATSAGRLPLVLRSRATPAGERLILGLFPGQSAEMLDSRVEELRAAARAMDVSVTRDRLRADRVTVDVIRRDLLQPALVLPSPLVGVAAALLPRQLVAGPTPGVSAASPAEEVSS